MLRKLVKGVRRQLTRLDQKAIERSLSAFGPFQQSTLLVHSSLSACGHIQGGPSTLVSGLRTWIDHRNLAMPTHTYCYPDKLGDAPVFDVRSTASVVGAVTNWFWQQHGVIRSVHPSHSLACQGPDAVALCADHDRCTTPCGAGTPYERLIQRDCAVLMFGATLNTYTLFHTTEDAAKVPYLYQPEQCMLRMLALDGSVRSLSICRQDMKVPRRFHEMDIWLEQRGMLKRQRFGMGELLYIPHAAKVHQAVKEELARDPLFLVAPGYRELLGKQLSRNHP